MKVFHITMKPFLVSNLNCVFLREERHRNVQTLCSVNFVFGVRRLFAVICGVVFVLFVVVELNHYLFNSLRINSVSDPLISKL